MACDGVVACAAACFISAALPDIDMAAWMAAAATADIWVACVNERVRACVRACVRVGFMESRGRLACGCGGVWWWW